MLNHITIMGRLVQDPELRRTGNGDAVASFRIACDRDYRGADGKSQVDFVDIVCWKKTGEFVSDHFHKGNPILISGRLEMRNWTDKNGTKRTTAEVNADHVYFCESKSSGQTSSSSASNFETLEQDDPELPF